MLDLSHRADLAWLADILRDAQQAVPDADWLLVGAMARDLWLSYANNIHVDRETTDVDLAIAVDAWQGFEATRDRLVGSGCFAPDRSLQRVRHSTGRLLDLVPFGGIEDVERQIAWPPAGDVRMNVIGCREAQAAADVVRLNDDVESKLITLPGLIMLKFFAFSDRALTQPRKDAFDLHLVLSHYLEAGNTVRLYQENADLLQADPFDFTIAGATLAGRDVRSLLEVHSENPGLVLGALAEILNRELQGSSSLLVGQVPLAHAEAFRRILLAFQGELAAGK